MNHTFTGQPGGRCIMCQVVQPDHEIALWSKQQNHGVPPWNSLSADTQAWWRERYDIRHRVAPSDPEAYQWPQVDLSASIEAIDSAARLLARVAPCRGYEESDAPLGRQEIPAEGTE